MYLPLIRSRKRHFCMFDLTVFVFTRFLPLAMFAAAPAARFEQLFGVQTKWTAEQLQPYVVYSHCFVLYNNSCLLFEICSIIDF